MIGIQPACLLQEFGEFLADQMGLHFPQERWSDLERGLQFASREFGFENTDKCIRWLLSAPLSREQVEILAAHLTVGETYFYRDKKTFEAFEGRILPELARLRRGGGQRLRIWSAGCCSGEEPYSIAISIRKVLADIKDWQVTVLGTDINPRFLRKAEEGVYSEWSFRDASPGLREAYFEKTGNGQWEILPEIRSMVSFLHFNLASLDSPLLIPADTMDMVFCRNVLIYFAPEQARRVIARMARCLAEGGWLALGPNEVSHVSSRELVPVLIPGATLYQRYSATSRSPETVPPRAVEDFPGTPAQPLLVPDFEWKTELAQTAVEEEEAGQSPQMPTRDHRGFDGETEAGRAVAETEPGSMLAAARVLADQGRLAEALAACDQAIAGGKLNPAAHYLRASILQEQGCLREVRPALLRSLYLDPDCILAHFALGNLARNQGKMAEADRHFANALRLARRLCPEDILPESGGLTAGRVVEIIGALLEEEASV